MPKKMKKFLLFLTLSASVNFVQAQTLTPEEAPKHIGEKVKVCGKVFGGRFFETSNNAPTLLNMGAAFPASPLTVMITKEVREKMGNAPEIELKDKNICVSGTLRLFKEKAEIVVTDASQIELK
jgi:hypothetical protein